MPITRYEGKTFEKQSFVVEECHFVNCVLKDCDLFYSGGETDWVGLSFQNCRWHWHGAAGRTFRLLVLLGMLKQQETPPQMTASNTKLMN
jgi:hypothetical protein